jgi:hypothetical protein
VGDIRFANSPEFSHRYVLRGHDEQAIRALFQPNVLDVINARPEAWAVQGAQGEWLIAYRPNVAMPPPLDGLREVLDGTYDVFTAFGIS